MTDHHHHDEDGTFVFWHSHKDDERLTDPLGHYLPRAAAHDHEHEPPCRDEACPVPSIEYVPPVRRFRKDDRPTHSDN